MIETLAHSAVWGFGSSFGRDVYRKAKPKSFDSIFWICVLALLFLAVWGYRGLARNISNRAQSNRGWRIFGSIVAVLFGIAGTIIVFGVFGEGHPRWDLAVVANLILALIGIVWGIIQKKKDEKEFDLAASNIAFLEEQGLRDSPFDADLIEDDDGNRLRIKETRDDAIVFSVVGKRDLRALISLDEEGRMLEYSGIVQL